MVANRLDSMARCERLSLSVAEEWLCSALQFSHAANRYSQCGEDGILDKILDTIGEPAGWCVEFGAWDGHHLSNTSRELWSSNTTPRSRPPLNLCKPLICLLHSILSLVNMGRVKCYGLICIAEKIAYS
jgi:hypothetical protein